MQEDRGEFSTLNMDCKVDEERAEKNPGLVFRVGERLKLKDGDFKVRSFGKKMIVLECLPGTRMKK